MGAGFAVGPTDDTGRSVLAFPLRLGGVLRRGVGASLVLGAWAGLEAAVERASIGQGNGARWTLDLVLRPAAGVSVRLGADDLAFVVSGDIATGEGTFATVGAGLAF